MSSTSSTSSTPVLVEESVEIPPTEAINETEEPVVLKPTLSRRLKSKMDEIVESKPTKETTETEKPPPTRARRASKDEEGWRYIVRNFTPSWFAVTMGTGIVGILMKVLPFSSPVLDYLAIIFFIFNTILFTLALIVSIMRYTLWPEIWVVMIHDPVNSLFLGCVPMGFATLINLWILICVPIWGDWAKDVALAAWIIDTVVSVACTICLPMMLITHDALSHLSGVTATQLLPIAATVVASGIGARLATVLNNPESAFSVLVTCYVLWGMSLPFAFMIFVLYCHRLIVHKLPPREVVVSALLPLGPSGYGATILIMLGKLSITLFPKLTGMPIVDSGPVLYAVGLFVGIIEWSFGLVWFFFAIAAMHRTGKFPFNMGWWGFTFPLGVYSAATLEIGEELDTEFFRILGTIFSCAVFVLWVVVAIGTVKGALSKKLFYAPCLRNLKQRDSDESLDSTSNAA